jgi:hypothetical protein
MPQNTAGASTQVPLILPVRIAEKARYPHT